MRICIFTETYFPVMGGGEIQARLLAEGLVSLGHSVIILTRRSDDSLNKYERFDEGDVYRLAPTGTGQLKKWGLIFSSVPALIRLRHQYDLIFVAGYRIIGITAVSIGKLLRKPVVLKADSQGEMSGDFFESGLKRFGISHTSKLFQSFLRFRNFILKKADAFSAISSDITAEWISSGIPPSRIHLIPNSVDIQRFVPVEFEQKNFLRKKLGLPLSATIAIYTGRLVSYKGLPLLLKVWYEILQKYDDILLILLGSGGLDIHNCENELRDYVKKKGLEKHVLFTGQVQNVPDYLQASDLFVFPTENEAFGASLVEAMACGLAVITTPIGAIKDIVSDKENGLLIKPKDHKTLYDALDKLLSDEKMVSQLGQTARSSVQDLFSSEIVTGKYTDFLQSLVTTEHSHDIENESR